MMRPFELMEVCFGTGYRPSIALGFLVFGIISCQNKSPQVVAAIDELKKVVMAADSINSSFPMDKIQLSLNENAELDSTHANWAKQLVFYHELIKQKDCLTQCERRHGAIGKQCNITLGQLDALRHDVEKGLMHPDTAINHLEVEFQYVESLSEAANENLAEVTRCMTNFDAWRDSLQMPR